MASSSAKCNPELQEEREQWLRVFCPLYADDISLQALQELQPDFVLSIYLQFLKITLNASLDNMKLIGLNCGDHMQRYPEAYEKAVLMPRVARVLSWFFQMFFGDNSFTFGDLMAPRPARTRQFFNGICQFVTSYTKAKESYDEVWRDVDVNRQHLAGRDEQLEQLKARVAQLQNQRAENIIQEEEELKCKQELSVELKRKQEEKASIRSQVEAAREKLAQLKSQLNEAKLDTLAAVEQQQSLQGSVVSAEELSAVQHSEQRLQQFREENAHKKDQCNEAEVWLSSEERMEGLFTNHIFPQVQDLQHQLDQLASISETKDVSLAQSRSISSCEEIDHQLSVHRQKQGQLQENLRACRQSWSKKREGMEAELRGQREMLEHLKKTGQDQDAEELALTAELEGCLQQLDALTREMDSLDEICDNTHTKLMQALEKHNNKTEEGLQQLITQIKKRPGK